MKPILKWVGGKTQLLQELVPLIQPYLKDNTYYEPFVGGGALAFALEYPNTIIGDMNSELTEMYESIRDHPQELLSDLREHQTNHNAQWYHMIRGLDRTGGIRQLTKWCRAARTIYLNKTCFNGLYRVNSKGYFNSPMGRTTNGVTPDIVQEDKILEMSRFLQTVQVRNCSYIDCVADAKPGDVVYFDPPYDKGTEIKTAGFVGYQKEGFTHDDLLLLKETCDALARKGCHVVISNNDTEFVRDLFKDYDIREVSAKRSINCKGSDRNNGKELIITKNI